MMAFAIANAPQVYDECDHNVMRLAPLHGCRARSARCADKTQDYRRCSLRMFRSDSKSDERNPCYRPRSAGLISKPSVAENVAPHSAERSPVGLSAVLTPPGSAPRSPVIT